MKYKNYGPLLQNNLKNGYNFPCSDDFNISKQVLITVL